MKINGTHLSARNPGEMAGLMVDKGAPVTTCPPWFDADASMGQELVETLLPLITPSVTALPDVRSRHEVKPFVATHETV